MTPHDFRVIALSMFAAFEGSHMGHADFRVGVPPESAPTKRGAAAASRRGATTPNARRSSGKPKAAPIFASLPPPSKAEPDTPLAMVRLTPEQQAAFINKHPGVFFPAPGAWGRSGCTFIRLNQATKRAVQQAVKAAWARTMSKQT